MRLIIFFFFGFAALAGILTSLYTHARHTQPPPQYLEENRTAHYPTTFISQIQHDPNAGKKIFAAYCATCHAENPVIPIHAPRIGHPKEWRPYHQLSMSTLFKLAATGYHAMPARGGCFECSDKQLAQAIHYLISSKK